MFVLLDSSYMFDIHVNVSDRLINVNRAANILHINIYPQFRSTTPVLRITYVLRKASRIYRVKGFARFINLLLPHPSAHTDYDQIITFKFLDLKVCNKLADTTAHIDLNGGYLFVFSFVIS